MFPLLQMKVYRIPEFLLGEDADSSFCKLEDTGVATRGLPVFHKQNNFS